MNVIFVSILETTEAAKEEKPVITSPKSLKVS